MVLLSGVMNVGGNQFNPVMQTTIVLGTMHHECSGVPGDDINIHQPVKISDDAGGYSARNIHLRWNSICTNCHKCPIMWTISKTYVSDILLYGETTVRCDGCGYSIVIQPV